MEEGYQQRYLAADSEKQNMLPFPSEGILKTMEIRSDKLRIVAKLYRQRGK